jgi:subtilase family serine protease
LKRTRVAVLTWGLAAVLLVLAGAGSADPGSTPTHWDFTKRVCALVRSQWVNCAAEVVSDANGVPLAGSSPPASALGPADFHAAYSLPTTAPSGGTIAIVDAYDHPTIESDLAAFDAYYGLPPCTTANGCFRKVDQYGGTNYPAADSGWALEISLDVEVAHAMCQNCKILLVEATTNSLYNLGTAENRAAALGATAISNSWGASEYYLEAQDELSYFHHPGIPITASTGDRGYGTEFPAASRYVTAVGGTTLFLGPGGSYQGETAWSGTGSGCSRYIVKPSWQHDSLCSHRTIADVSADADPNTGAAVFDSVPYSGQTGWFQIGGTSLAAPLVAATYVLAGGTSSVADASGLYAHASSLHDVTSGSNGSYCGSYLCQAGSGYDGPTGNGTPSGLAAFGSGSGGPPPPTQDFSLGINPSSRTVTAGSGTSYTVTLSRSGGFSGDVALSVSGLPGGASAGFTPSTLSGSATSATLTVDTSAGVVPGGYSLTIKGTGGTLTRTVPATLSVQAGVSPDFSLGISPSSRTVTAGNGTSYTVTLSTSGGFSNNVALGTSGLPAGVSTSFSPSSLGSSTSSTLTLTTSGSLAPGTYPFSVTGTSGSLAHSAPASLVVQSAAPPPPPSGDFTISVSPSSATVPSTGTSTFTVTITPSAGFSGQVTLGTAGYLPWGVSVSFSPNPSSGTSTLTLATNHWFHRGGSTITITGTGGGHTHSTTLSISL